MRTIRIVLTGGPGSGKTKTIETMKKAFSTRRGVFEFCGRRCLFVPETASELILGGIAPFTCAAVKDFQDILFDLQLSKEKAFEKATESIPAEKFIIFYDRGLIDGGAYITDEEYDEILLSRNTSKAEICAGYDAVFALEAPKEEYTTENNAARTENKDDAYAIGNRTRSLWEAHPKLFFVPAKPAFEEKFDVFLKMLSKIVSEFEEFA